MKRTVFVTGGSRGIGRALVAELAEQGYNVAFTYNSNREMADTLISEISARVPEAKVAAYQLDVRNSAQVDDVADQVLNDFDGVYAVIPNAGVSLNNLVYSMTDEDWDFVISTNLTGTFYVCRAFLPEMVANKVGRIVMLSSVTAPGAAGQAAYAASKSGLQGLCGSIAREYGPKGVTANLVLPGYFETDMTKAELSERNFRFAVDFGPLRRGGTLDELAKTISFLISDASGFITGESIRVAGGLEWVP